MGMQKKETTKKDDQGTKKTKMSIATRSKLKGRDESFSDSKHPRKHDTPKISRNPRGSS
ncbi:MAG TPA: hypothetical protein VN040_10515 [Pseudosphingobacterium sp.]|nr:hypothetical protein [Pseudosphingobacterium sp.]